MKKILYIILLTNFAIPNKSFAFSVYTHEHTISAHVLEIEGFSTIALFEVNQANATVDLHQHQPTFHADNNQLGGASTRLRTKKNEVVSSLLSCKGDVARQHLGQAFHTLQDIYSHSNAVDDELLHLLEGDGILNLSNGVSPCFRINFGAFSLYSTGSPDSKGGLVSGYFPGIFLNDGECSHGELNKDSFGSSNGVSHQAAVDEARIGTQRYLNLIYEQLSNDVPIGEDFEFYKKILKNKQRKTILVVDSTGSMENDIESIKTRINSYLDSLVSTGNYDAPTLGLVTFKDNEEDFVESDLICKMSDYRLKINSLSAIGGDDCEESSLESVQQVLYSFENGNMHDNEIPLGGDIILYTDASAHNPSMKQSLINSAQRKNVNISFNITGDCETIISKSANQKNNIKPRQVSKANIKPNFVYSYYQEISESTGGVSFSVDKSELEELMPISLFMTDPQTETIASHKASLENEQNFESIIKIDASVSQETVMILVKTLDGSINMPNITLTNPQESIVLNVTENVDIINLSTMKVYIIQSPTIGDWKVNLSDGNSKYLIRAFAKTEFRIMDFTLLREIELLEESGIDALPIDGNPTIGEELIIKIDLTQNPDLLTLKFLREDQSIILEPSLVLVDGTTSTYKASFTVPNEAFQLKLTGSLNGSQFQREIPVSVKPKMVRMMFDTTVENISDSVYGVQSQIKSFNLHITNADSNGATYSLSANSQQNSSITIQDQITVLAGQTITVPVSVSIPTDAIVGSLDEIMIIVEDVNDENNNNYKVANLIIRSVNLFKNSFE